MNECAQANCSANLVGKRQTILQDLLTRASCLVMEIIVSQLSALGLNDAGQSPLSVAVAEALLSSPAKLQILQLPR